LGAPAGVEIVNFDDRGGRLKSALQLAARVREIVKAKAPDIVHIHSTFAGAVLRPGLFLRRKRLKLVYCAHGWAFDRQTSPCMKYSVEQIERWLALFCDAIVCISDYELRVARRCGIPKEKLALIRNGVPSESPRPDADHALIEWPEGQRRVLFVGRFDRQKGADVLLRALADLKDKAFGYLVGGAVLGDAELGAIPNNARLVSWLSPAKLEPFYRSADVVVVPSRWEGFGLIAAEAMRAGLPVIASRVGGLTEVVEDHVTGVLIAPDDKPALIQALMGLSDDQLHAMGNAGRERFLKNFTMERTHRQLCDLYQRITAGAI
jgi:glycosyltransferase involved in cell wall biosynthesis